MSLDAPRLDGDALTDDFQSRPVLAQETAFRGMVWDVRADRIDLGPAGQVTRQYIEHPGAVSIVALRERPGGPDILLIKQYRHPVRATEWELPAGLLDVPGERAQEAAARELAEEADLRAETWHLLTDLFPSPGGLGEAIRIFLAQDLSEVPATERHDRDAEELGMPTAWVPLDQAESAVLSGRLTNGVAQLGILATAAARRHGWNTLRSADTEFLAHPGGRG
ncbi:ADP-ribose pyrophosphatase [Austwickia chelonae]|uniref:ADP-ribose pyrophosphatase n=1 Tax=Austwickia chelonae NBRC 105200 TaxID=1184607 RepID=K6VQS6_9MICO|nr:NUDIX hydrolase [Austwickia chelonae]GAB77720.1 ADP-ribose pyrophosphatase [Austwickia chelonae NBRC 105200]SEW16508.1 ADP-ribose pyrophosphatase [Austwickia chelonae]